MTGSPPKLFALFGNPVGHSLSPAMHNAALEEIGVKGIYVAVQVEHLESAVRGISGMGICGVSVTIPFKARVMKYLDAVDPEARHIGAVNTIVNRNGRLTGYNTDWRGIVEALSTKMTIENKKVIILGAGGTARAALFGIIKKGGDPVIVNRTESKGRRLAKEWKCPFVKMDEINDISGDCLINTTPVGMWPDVDKSPLSLRSLKNFAVVMDVIYNPLKTKLIIDAETAGCTALSGLDMFIFQGAEQIKLWTGKEPPISLMRKVVTEALEGVHGK